MPWNSPSLHILLLVLLVPYRSLGQDEDEFFQVVDEGETRSRMILYDNNIVFVAGSDSNITFRTYRNSSIFLGDTDIRTLPKIAAIDKLHPKLDALVPKIDDAVENLESTESLTDLLNEDSNKLTAVIGKGDSCILFYWDKVNNLDCNFNHLHLRRIEARLSMDVCVSLHPCESGGTCIPGFGDKFTCLCPPHRTGPKCDFDVDECEEYQGTTSGCQNNSTCENTDVGFTWVGVPQRKAKGYCSCHCPTGFRGTLCEFEAHEGDECSVKKICGEHGTCLPLRGSLPAYKCICDEGYASKDIDNPSCVDINECLSSPCHHGSDCINLPGSFRCTGCALGYDGNGRTCADVDECEANPCSKKPKVRCFNTAGSFECDSCPPGFEGDGFTCKRFSPCSSSSPCHPLAECVDHLASDTMTSVGGYDCHCPKGFVGDGRTVNGCEPANVTICNEEESKLKCLNGGNCTALTADKPQCKCVGGYTGSNCERPSPCISAPCHWDAQKDRIEGGNNGRCIPFANGQYECECPRSFYGDKCEEQEDLCGVHQKNITGIVSFPEDFGSPELRPQCDLVISPHSVINKALEIWFIEFGDMPIEARITIYDGLSGDDPVVAEFCGQNRSDINCQWSIKAENVHDWIVFEFPELQMRSGNHSDPDTNILRLYNGLHVYPGYSIFSLYSSLDTVTRKQTNSHYAVLVFMQGKIPETHRFYNNTTPGFTIKWWTIEGEFDCGGDLVWNGTTPFAGSIQTPGYPHKYVRGTSCTWNIGRKPSAAEEEGTAQKNASHFHLRLRFEHFDIPSNAPVIQRPQNRIQNRFRHPYDRHLGSLGRFRMDASLPEWENKICREDFVSVSGQQPFCRQRYPPKAIIVKDDFAVVQFTSKNRDGNGFKMTYEIVCAHEFSSPSGAFSSFNFPFGGASFPIVCTYTINSSPQHAVHIIFKHLNCDGQSELDYIKIHGMKKLNYSADFNLCEEYGSGEEITTSGGTPIVITHSTSGRGINLGFLFEYNTTEIGCGGVFNTNKGTLKSPNFPDRYPDHLHCEYKISVSLGKRIRLVFDFLDLELSPYNSRHDCNFDHIDIYDEYYRTKSIGRYCGNDHIPPIISTGNQLIVEFFTDNGGVGTGFLAKFEEIDEASCDGSFTAPSGNIVYTGGTLHHKCEFHIALPSNSRMLLKINSLSLPCHVGKLQLRNGVNLESPGFTDPLNSEICGPQSSIISLRSHSNRVFLLLSANNGLLRDVSFNISYESISSGCGGHLNGLRGSLSSPQYPVKDRKIMDCTWRIDGARGNRVSLSIEKMDSLQPPTDREYCKLDERSKAVLSVYNSDSANEGSLLLRTCSQLTDSSPLVSSEGSLTLNYRHTTTLIKPVFGFIAHFTTECKGITLTGFTGVIESPGYNLHTLEKTDCQWTILVPPGNRIRLTFRDFKISNRSPSTVEGCGENNLMISLSEMSSATFRTKEGEVIESTTINKFCNSHAIPQEIMSKDNRLTISFTSGSEKDNQFILHWKTIGCGGELIAGGPIQASLADFSELLPNDASIECGWSITAPVGQVVHLDVSELNIYHDQMTCNHSHFVGMGIFSGPSNASGYVVDKMCDPVHEDKHFIFNSSDNSIYVQLKLKRSWLPQNREAIFFKVSISFVEGDGKCGGRMKVDRNRPVTIFSKDYPNVYPRGVICDWVLETLPGHTLNITIYEFVMAADSPPRIGHNLGANVSICAPFHRYQYGVLSVHTATERLNIHRPSSTDFKTLCRSISQPESVVVMNSTAGITFIGGWQERNGNALPGSTFGFRLEARAHCGGTVRQLRVEHLTNMNKDHIEFCDFDILPNPNLANGERVFVHFTAMETKDYGKVPPEAERSHIEHEMQNLHFVQVTVDGQIAETYELSSIHTKSKTFTGENSRAEVNFYQKVAESKEAFECDWTIQNTPGNTVSVKIEQLSLPPPPTSLPTSDDCSQSFLEIRETNSTGNFIGRYCHNVPIVSEGAQSLWIRLRFVPETKTTLVPDGEEEAEERVDIPQLVFTFEKKSGGSTSSHVIETPLFNIRDQTVAWKIAAKPDHAIIIHVERLQISEENPLRITRVPTAPSTTGEILQSISGTSPPEADIYVAESEVILRLEKADRNDRRQSSAQFRLSWQSIPMRGNQSEAEEDTQYTCGEVLMATGVVQTLQYPPPNGVYKANENCRWTIVRPQFYSIELRIVDINLDETPNCESDYVLIPSWYNPEGRKFCSKTQINRTLDFDKLEKVLHILFVSSLARESGGFIIEFSLTCQSFETIKAGAPFSATLEYPGIVYQLEEQQKCEWNVFFDSRRRVAINITNMNLSCRNQQGSKPGLTVGSSWQEAGTVLCGTQANLLEEQRKLVVPAGRVHIEFNGDIQFTNPTFTIVLSEITEACSSDHIQLDESNPRFTLTSPLWPESLYIPSGLHSRQFEGPLHLFLVPGPSESQQDTEYPSLSIASAWNHRREMIPNAVTITSWSAMVQVHNLPPMQYIAAPNHRLRSTPLTTIYMLEELGLQNSNCTLDYFSIRDRNESGAYLIGPLCREMDIAFSWNSQAVRSSRDILVVQFVYSGPFSHARYSLDSGCFHGKCGFSLKLSASKISCGGEISDISGNLTVPGYPDKLIQNVECYWTFRAGSGFRYIFQMEFAERRGIYHEFRWPPEHEKPLPCNDDIYLADGPLLVDEKFASHHRQFCENVTSHRSHSDIAIIGYHGKASQYRFENHPADDKELFEPFSIAYTKVATSPTYPDLVDPTACQHVITDEGGVASHSMIMPVTGTKWPKFCHIAIKRTTNRTGTTFLSFANYKFDSIDYDSCHHDLSHMYVVASEENMEQDLIVNLEERICNASVKRLSSNATGKVVEKPMTITTATPLVDIYVVAPTPMSFNLIVTFHYCGATIEGEQDGTLTSPNFGKGRIYLPNQHCVWVIKAPEGKRVQLTVAFMDIQFEEKCRLDALIVGEGESNSHVETYCHLFGFTPIYNPAALLDDRRKSHISWSRVFVLTWITDGYDEHPGWKINYKFVGGSECGFSSSALTGTIHTPNYPHDYPKSEECIWHITVPEGYYIRVHFNMLDIQKSENCSSDGLISEFHSMNELTPNGEWFLQHQDTEQHPPYCDTAVPSRDFESQSNKIQLNFSSNGDEHRGRGFEVTWTAECGAVFTRPSGVVTSPHYPSFYPNADMTCSYLISPRIDGIENPLITIKIDDVQLSDVQTAPYNRKPCWSDYLQIIDPYKSNLSLHEIFLCRNHTLWTYCGNSDDFFCENHGPSCIPRVLTLGENFTFQGPIEIKLVTNYSHQSPKNGKMMRGFKIIYTFDECGFNKYLTGPYSAAWLQSPGYITGYHENIECIWNITTEPNRFLEIQYRHFDIEESKRCTNDYFEIFEGSEMTNETTIGKYCGKDAPWMPTTINSPAAFFRFVANDKKSHAGFQIIVKSYLGPKAGCGGLLNATGNDGSMLELQLVSLKTEKCFRRTCWDSLTIFDGLRAASPHLLASPMSTRPDKEVAAQSFHSSSRKIDIVFKTDGSLNAEGFELKYRSVEADCGGLLIAKTTKQSTYDSPCSKPREGQTHRRCKYHIRAEQQAPKCYHPSCPLKESEKKKVRECGVHPKGIAPFISRTTEVGITTAFEFGDPDSEFGFEYYLLDIIPAGRFTSPIFPQPYNHNSTCTTTITAKDKQRLFTVFRVFDVEDGERTHLSLGKFLSGRIPVMNCTNDYLEYMNEAGSIWKYCNGRAPKTIYEEKNKMMFTFATDDINSHEGYDASYFTIDMIGEDTYIMGTYKETSGALASIGYPGSMLKSSTQKFALDPPGAHTCKLTFTNVDFNKKKADGSCGTEEYVEISYKEKGKNELNTHSLDPCAKRIEPNRFFSFAPGTTDIAVTFKTDSVKENDGDGFRAEWNCDYETKPLLL